MIICPARALFHPLDQDYSEHANHDTLSRRAFHSRRITNAKRRYLASSLLIVAKHLKNAKYHNNQLYQFLHIEPYYQKSSDWS